MRLTIFYILLVSCVGYALLRGGGPERSVAATYFSVGLLDRLAHSILPAEYGEMDPWHLAIDFVMWATFLIIALRAKRFWPLWVVSLQTIALVAHMVKLADVSVHPQAYYIMQVAYSYPLLITLAIGTYLHQRRLLINGIDPSWRGSLPRWRPNKR